MDNIVKYIPIPAILAALMFFQNSLQKNINNAYEYCINKITSSIVIKKERSPRLFISIEKELEKKKTNHLTVIGENNGSTFYSVPKDRYKICHDSNIICVEYDIDTIILWRYGMNNEILKKYVAVLNSQYTKPDCARFYYNISKKGWNYPIMRDTILSQHITSDMQSIISDFETFFTSSESYIARGQPYRRGYLLTGKPGTGKTSCVDHISNKYNMCVYSVTLNTQNLDDCKLKQYIMEIPERSIILIDEFDRQYSVIRENNPRLISDGGLLSIFDGIPSISNGSVIFLTANTFDNVGDADFRAALLRIGRIDVERTLSILINP